jgi:7-cyano-7-deazaguanine synthase
MIQSERSPGLRSLAILVSGGLDSAILLSESIASGSEVYPLYIRQGLVWETVELSYLQRYLQALPGPRLHPLTILEMPVADLYVDHWSITGRAVPDAASADAAVFLPGRNVLLLAKAILWCALRRVPAIALAPLETNPFPDATAGFFKAYEKVVNEAVGGTVQVLRPYANLDKEEVMRRGRALPLHLTFSCIRPVDGRHCGRCNKCAERRRAFAAAGLADPTEYEAPRA